MSKKTKFGIPEEALKLVASGAIHHGFDEPGEVYEVDLAWAKANPAVAKSDALWVSPTNHSWLPSSWWRSVSCRPVGKVEALTIRIEAKTARALHAAASRLGVPVSSIVRSFIETGLSADA